MGFNDVLGGAFLEGDVGKLLVVKSDGVYYGTTSSITKLATVTDLSDYLPLTGGVLARNAAKVGNILILDNTINAPTETTLQFKMNGSIKGSVGFKSDGTGQEVFLRNDISDALIGVGNSGYPIFRDKNGSTNIVTEKSIKGYNYIKSSSTTKVTDIQVVNALPTTQASGVLYLVVK